MSNTNLFIEAESFESFGGWLHDQQFMDQMGSPYLLAHGLGQPVRDAKTNIIFSETGAYRVWVRTIDWVAKWSAAGSPGRFQVIMDGKPLNTDFGINGAEWHWQDGGTVEVKNKEMIIALHDLTGFEGRCDALFFSKDLTFIPPNEKIALEEFRRMSLGFNEVPEEREFDFIVAGGGIAGVCCALVASRLGLKTALIQDRPVVGGNNSSEVRVWLNGQIQKEPWPHVGDVVKELDQKKRAHEGDHNTAEIYEDDKKIKLLKEEKNLELFLDCRLINVDVTNSRIQKVMIQSTLTAQRISLKADFFSDCTGDGCMGVLAGADHTIVKEGHLGPTNLWYTEETSEPQNFQKCPWALDLTNKPFPGRNVDYKGQKQIPEDCVNTLGLWYWESGFDWHPIDECESMRDWNFRAMYGAWDALKNIDKVHIKRRLKWAAYITGKRESVQLLGDVVLTKKDIIENRPFKDEVVPCSWSLDLHYPDENYQKGFEGNEFISRADFGEKPDLYWMPYRCLYSRNIENLFMAGRDISVEHEALGTVRVMNTCGMMGEIVGMAASIAKQENINPRGVYENHLSKLQELMVTGAGINRISQKV